jgi:hypothetical protein
MLGAGIESASEVPGGVDATQQQTHCSVSRFSLVEPQPAPPERIRMRRVYQLMKQYLLLDQHSGKMITILQSCPDCGALFAREVNYEIWNTVNAWGHGSSLGILWRRVDSSLFISQWRSRRRIDVLVREECHP